MRSTGSTPPSGPRAPVVAALVRVAGPLATSAMARMEEQVAWFADLGAEERAWVGQIVQAGVRDFVTWFAEEDDDGARRAGGLPSSEVAASVFGAAPRDLAGRISLQQTVDLVRLSIEAVEGDLDHLLDVGPEVLDDVRASITRYAREVAFATAEVYARAAEARGAWDARLEALVVDAVLRAEADETVLSRASALGFDARGAVVVVLGSVPELDVAAAPRTESDLVDAVRRTARDAGHDALCAVQGDRLVVLLGAAEDPRAAAAVLADLLGPGPLVVGPPAPTLDAAHVSARGALAAHRAAAGWPEAPRPVASGDLLPERALAGDGHARRHLVEEVYLPLVRARGALVESVTAYLASGGSVEGSARTLFVHPNTVRYRLRQVAELTGCTATEPRDALTLQIALILGRQSGRTA